VADTCRGTMAIKTHVYSPAGLVSGSPVGVPQQMPCTPESIDEMKVSPRSPKNDGNDGGRGVASHEGADEGKEKDERGSMEDGDGQSSSTSTQEAGGEDRKDGEKEDEDTIELAEPPDARLVALKSLRGISVQVRITQVTVF
jgi:hypothetical protein